METATATKTRTTTKSTTAVGKFLGEMFAFNNSLKLYHWNVTGKGSYAQHMALDQALESLTDVLDRIAETSIAVAGDIEVAIPKTEAPGNIIRHAEKFYDYVHDQRKNFSEDFTDGIIDDYQEAIQQLLYRLKRLQ